MKVRIGFAKFDRMRFLGHLDVMRFFQHAIARAGLPVAYSAGFHPHMILSFAQPLALSVSSDGEYFDVELTEDLEAQEIKERLQGAMCDGFAITDAYVLPPQEPNTKKQTGMSLIAGALYLLEETESYRGQLLAAATALAAAQKAVVTKPTKNGTRDVDVRSGIHALGIVSEDGTIRWLCDDDVFAVPENLTEGFGAERSRHAAHRPGALRMLFAVDAGSENNISAELLSDALSVSGGIPEGRMFSSHRMELYGLKDGHMESLLTMK